MKLNELVYDVREMLSQHHDDSSITDEYIIYNINNIRSVILKSQMNSFNQIISPIVQQTLCLEVELTDPYECGMSFGCERILRTVEPIPTPIKHYLGLALTSVKPVNMLSTPLVKIDQSSAQYISPSRGRSKNTAYYFIGSDMRIYIVGSNETLNILDCISVTGVFTNPLDLSNYKKCCDCNGDEEEVCYDYLTSDYPMDNTHASDLTDLVFRKLIQNLQIPKDNLNDAKDENTREQD